MSNVWTLEGRISYHQRAFDFLKWNIPPEYLNRRVVEINFTDENFIPPDRYSGWATLKIIVDTNFVVYKSEDNILIVGGCKKTEKGYDYTYYLLSASPFLINYSYNALRSARGKIEITPIPLKS